MKYLLVIVMLFLILFAENIFSQRIGKTGEYALNPPVLFKGQKVRLFGYNIVNLEGDFDSDGITRSSTEIPSYSDSSNKHPLSLRKDFQADMELSPPQGDNIKSFYVDAANLQVGNTYHFWGVTRNEPPSISSGVGVRVGVAKEMWLTIIPYDIPILEKSYPRGTFSKATISWQKPSPLYWNINYYSIFRRSDDSVKINQLSSCEKLRFNIPSNQFSSSIDDAPRNVNSYYAVVAYDSLGEAIAISRSFQLEKNSETFSLLSLYDDQISKSLTPTLDWQDYGTNNFTLWISEDSTFTTKTEITGITASNYTFSTPLEDHKCYYWKVKEINGDWSNETGWRFKTNVLNLTPNSFELQTPSNSQTITTRVPSLQWQDSQDNGDVVTYNILIATDSEFNNVVLDKTTICNYYNLIDSLNDNTQYYWKVKATDSEGLNLWCNDYFTFSTNQNDYPSKFTLLYPLWNTAELPVETNLTPTFQWTESTDSDPGSSVSYTLWYGQDSTFAVKTKVSGITETSYQVSTPLEEDKIYYWKAFAVDNSGLVSTHYGLPYAFVTNSANNQPTQPILSYPANESTINPDLNAFSWNSSVDQDVYDIVLYDLIISSTQNFADTIFCQTNIPESSFTVSHLEPGIKFWKIIARSIKCNGQSGGISESEIKSFTVDQSRIFVLTPNSKSKWAKNLSPYITWSYNYVCNQIKLEYSTDNGNNWTLIEDNLNSSPAYYLWTIPNSLSGSNLIFRASDVNNNYIYGESVTTLINNTQDADKLVFHLPFNGNLQDSSGNGITVTCDNPVYVSDRNQNSGKALSGTFSFPILKYDFSQGFAFTFWVKPTGVDGDKYLALSNGTTNFDFMKYDGAYIRFYILGQAVDYFSLLLGYWNFVVVTTDNLGNTKVYVNGDLAGTTTVTMPSIEPFYGNSNINFGSSIDDYRLYNRNLTQQEIISLFSENRRNDWNISLTNPTSNKQLHCTSTENITWASQNVSNIKIDYSTNSGTSWTNISNEVNANNGSYNWTVPKVNSTECLLRLSDTNKPFVFTISDQNFTIYEYFSHVYGYGMNRISARWADLNNDGLLEVISNGKVWLSGFQDKTFLFQYNGSSFNETMHDFVGTLQGAIEWIDFQNDNWIDALCYGTWDVTYLSLIKNNSGAFANIAGQLGINSNGVFNSGDIKTADYNNDGKSDFIIAGNNNLGLDNIADLFINSGSMFSKNSNNGIIKSQNTKMFWADLDNDCDFDLIKTGDGNTNIYVNNNDGTFTNSGISLLGTVAGNVTCFDYDNNSLLDILISGNGNTVLYRNDGNMNFSDTGFILPQLTYGSINTGDYNNDGKSDILFGGRDNSSEITTVYVNNGNSFTNINDGLNTGEAQFAEFGDYNLDGRIDLLVVYGNGFNVFKNNLEIRNTAPTTPLNLRTESPALNKVRFSWNHATDSQTPWRGLSYNLRIGTTPGGVDILSPMSNPLNGYRKIPSMGNVQCDTNWVINNLPAGTYYWSVQAIDNGYMGGNFAEEQTFTIDQNGALPVELVRFEAAQFNKNVKLKWETATEVNNYGFNIEKKRNDIWFKTGFVQGHGNSNSPKFYEYIDNDIISGKNYYRLKQIDFDGKFEYSKTVEIEIDKPLEYKLTQNYPNPFNPTTTIKYEIPQGGLVNLKVYDVLGNEVATLVNQDKAAGRYEINFDASQLSSGVYFYKLSSGNFYNTKKFILMK